MRPSDGYHLSMDFYMVRLLPDLWHSLATDKSRAANRNVVNQFSIPGSFQWNVL